MRVHGSRPGTDSRVIRGQSVITSPQAPQFFGSMGAKDHAHGQRVITPVNVNQEVLIGSFVFG